MHCLSPPTNHPKRELCQRWMPVSDRRHNDFVSGERMAWTRGSWRNGRAEEDSLRDYGKPWVILLIKGRYMRIHWRVRENRSNLWCAAKHRMRQNPFTVVKASSLCLCVAGFKSNSHFGPFTGHENEVMFLPNCDGSEVLNRKPLQLSMWTSNIFRRFPNYLTSLLHFAAIFTFFSCIISTNRLAIDRKKTKWAHN